MFKLLGTSVQIDRDSLVSMFVSFTGNTRLTKDIFFRDVAK